MGQGALSRAGGGWGWGRCTHRTQGCSIPKVLAKDRCGVWKLRATGHASGSLRRRKRGHWAAGVN